MNVKNFLILLYLIFTCETVMSQLGASREDIIEAFGKDYTTGMGNFNAPYIAYSDEMTSVDNDPYDLISIFYFITMDNGEQRCTHMKFIYPISEKASLQSFYNENFKVMDSVTWQDTSTRYLYHMTENYPYCALMIWLGVDEYSYSSVFGNSKK